VTLILAIRSTEGIIVASDSQATATPGGSLSQAYKVTAQKLFHFAELSVFGATGPVGVIQNIHESLSQIHRGSIAERRESDVRRTLKNAIYPIQQEAFKGWVQQAGGSPAVICLLCGYCKSGPWIIEIDANGGDQSYTDAGFHAIGSGEQGAVLVHAALAHYGVVSRTALQAQLIAYRVMDAAISTIGFGVGHPIVIWKVSEAGIQVLTKEEIDGIRDTVSTWLEAEADTLPSIITQSNPRA